MDLYVGGNTNWWTYAYSWMLKYLDQSVVGHQGLAHYVDNFLSYRCMIQQYVQHNHQRELIDRMMTIVPGINFMPCVVFGFIDDSIDQILTPFSGPRGNYEGAAHKAEYADAQQAFYSSYIKNHKIKVEIIFFAKWSLDSVRSHICLTS